MIHQTKKLAVNSIEVLSVAGNRLDDAFLDATH
jgi:hypothetical protein